MLPTLCASPSCAFLHLNTFPPPFPLRFLLLSPPLPLPCVPSLPAPRPTAYLDPRSCLAPFMSNAFVLPFSPPLLPSPTVGGRRLAGESVWRVRAAEAADLKSGSCHSTRIGAISPSFRSQLASHHAHSHRQPPSKPPWASTSATSSPTSRRTRLSAPSSSMTGRATGEAPNCGPNRS